MRTGETSRDAVYESVIDAIESWNPHEGPTRWSDERFDRLAGRVFRHQYDCNEPYREFCRRREVAPADVETYRDIPAVATEVFKHADLSCAEEPVRIFRTSGTTGGWRGRHGFETLEVYRASLHPPFIRFCNPERDEFRMLVCAPSPRELPDDSLSFMFGELVDVWGDDRSRFFASSSAGEGELSFDFEGFAGALDRAEAEGVETFVLSTAFGFAEFFDRGEGSWNLPPGSRVFETGGFKGTSREFTRAKLYRSFEARFGLDVQQCIGEYSMTELSSQAYTSNLIQSDGAAPSKRGFIAPPWARVEVVDPVDGSTIRTSGEQGLIRWYDLANVGSVLAVQTSDLGTVTENGGVVHLGRAEGASLRGCSLTAEAIARSGN